MTIFYSVGIIEISPEFKISVVPSDSVTTRFPRSFMSVAVAEYSVLFFIYLILLHFFTIYGIILFVNILNVSRVHKSLYSEVYLCLLI